MTSIYLHRRIFTMSKPFHSIFYCSPSWLVLISAILFLSFAFRFISFNADPYIHPIILTLHSVEIVVEMCIFYLTFSAQVTIANRRVLSFNRSVLSKSQAGLLKVTAEITAVMTDRTGWSAFLRHQIATKSILAKFPRRYLSHSPSWRAFYPINNSLMARDEQWITSYRDEVSFSERDVARVVCVAVVLDSSCANVRTGIWAQTTSQWTSPINPFRVRRQ